jgi:hypothetical protein
MLFNKFFTFFTQGFVSLEEQRGIVYYVNQIKLTMKNIFSYIVKNSILKETYLMKKYQIYLKMQVISWDEII